jgi:hypothetical protein
MIFYDAILDLCSAGFITTSEVEAVASFAWSIVHGFAMLVSGVEGVRPDSSESAIEDLLERAWRGVIGSK